MCCCRFCTARPDPLFPSSLGLSRRSRRCGPPLGIPQSAVRGRARDRRGSGERSALCLLKPSRPRFRRVRYPPMATSIASVDPRVLTRSPRQVQPPFYTFCALHSHVASGILAGFNLRQRSSMRSIICAALAAGSLLMSVPPAFAQNQTQRGKYLATIML